LGRKTSWLVMNSRSMSRKSFTRASFISRSLHRVVGKILGRRDPAPADAAAFFFFLMRVSGFGSNFFFFGASSPAPGFLRAPAARPGALPMGREYARVRALASGKREEKGTMQK